MASLFGYSTTEEPAYTVVDKKAEYEVREYGAQIRATCTVDGGMEGRQMGTAFRMLAGYIFGKNTAPGGTGSDKVAMTAPVAVKTQEASSKIAMTAPVAVTSSSRTEGEGSGAKMTMQFIVPSKYKSVSELPVPKDTRVTFEEVPARKYAVIRFSWAFDDKHCREHEQTLRQAASRDGLALSSNPQEVQFWGYNPPWTLPWCRRNEVAIPVA